jgi:signal transduction histidine kinase
LADHRSLIERRPDRAQVQVAVVIGALWLASGLCIYLFREPVYQFNAFVLVVDAMLLLSDLVTAILLFAQASVFRSRALLALAGGYLFSALMAIPHALVFPGVFAPDGLLGGDLSRLGWVGVFWRMGLPIAICIYAALKPKDSLRHRRPSITAATGGAVLAAIALSTLAIGGLLPPLVKQPQVWSYPNALASTGVVIATCVTAIVMLAKGEKSRLDVWLLLSLVPWLVHLLLITSITGKITLAWYFAHGAAVVSHIIVMLALIAEASWTYAQLALSLSARDRERDARLMSMDAVAAAIAHEVRQPLAAMVTNASAGLRWLERPSPNLEMAIQSLRSNVEEGHRASSLIESMRSMLADRTGERTAFCLNQLVRETTSMLHQELAQSKIMLHLALDEALPLIVADRVQIQQVLLNLFTNAIEALQETRRRPRRIAIHSSINRQDVLLDVSDNGIGIGPDKMEHMFDAFFTTKPSGTGMGLSLCRAIVEKHGGRLWASQLEEHGATFHLQLHSEPVARRKQRQSRIVSVQEEIAVFRQG